MFQNITFAYTLTIMMIIPSTLFCFFLLPIINALIGRCYLCSEEILPECNGNNQMDSSILQYFTEPCNGQCILFRNENHSIVRGCSWTYGHMFPKSIGWHEISPGIPAYFCDSHLCNNGTYNQQRIYPPEHLVLLATNNPSKLQIRSLPQQCYSCTARFQGCGEFLDPHYASKYIRSCPTSCIIFRNPNDLNLITRDCAIFWPQVNIKHGFHKLFNSDAFFCQEPLCNGISLDFVMGIFQNQLPTPKPLINIYNDSLIWDDPDLDVDFSTSIVTLNLTNIIDNFDKILPNNYTIIENVTMENSTSMMNISTTVIEEDEDSVILNATSIQLSTRFEHLVIEDEDPAPTLTEIFSSIPEYFRNNQLFDYSLAIPPFSWMLNTATENQTVILNTTTTIPITSTTISTTSIPVTSYEYCKNKQCQYDGRLTSDCLCLCLPAFTGENCETVLCDDEPGDICAFILEHECEDNHIRYICPKFCQLDICTLNTE